MHQKILLPSPISTIDLTIRMPTSMFYYTPKNAESAPTILWIHGGGWLAGNKNDLSPWARILAGKGFNVIALNYSLAPEKKYPLPTVQANAALHYFNDHADELRLNPNKLIIGGDSAGAQIAAQITLIETNPEYDPALCHRQLPAQLHHGRQHRPAAPPFQSARHGSQKNRRHH